MNSQIFSSLSNLVEEAIDFLSGELVTESYIRRSSIQMKFEILTGLLIRPELYEYEQVLGLTEIIEEMASLGQSSLLSFSLKFDEILVNFVSKFYIKIMFEVNYSMNRFNETEFSSISAMHLSYSDKLESIKTETESLWTATEKYLIRTSSKINSEDSYLKYTTDVGTFQIEYKIANSLTDTIYDINSAKGYKVSFPSNLFDESSLTDLNNSVRVVAISWIISPMLLSNEDSTKFASDLLSIHLVDANQNIIQIRNKEVVLTMTFSYNGFKAMNDLSCKAWSFNLYRSTLNDAECTIASTDVGQGAFTN